MFYLLENNRKIQNNRIIDSNKYDNDSLVFYESLAGNLLYEVIPSSIRTEIRLGLIKKQSENVFDLVEMGDCYLYQNKNMLRPDILLINDKVMLSIFGNRALLRPNEILAIYKPNANGDYIKVWGRKEE